VRVDEPFTEDEQALKAIFEARPMPPSNRHVRRRVTAAARRQVSTRRGRFGRPTPALGALAAAVCIIVGISVWFGAPPETATEATTTPAVSSRTLFAEDATLALADTRLAAVEARIESVGASTAFALSTWKMDTRQLFTRTQRLKGSLAQDVE